GGGLASWETGGRAAWRQPAASARRASARDHPPHVARPRSEFVVVDGPEVVLQIRVHDPLRARFDLSPHLTQSVLGGPTRSVAKAAVVKERLENRLKPIEQRLFAHPVNTRPKCHGTPLPRVGPPPDIG